MRATMLAPFNPTALLVILPALIWVEAERCAGVRLDVAIQIRYVAPVIVTEDDLVRVIGGRRPRITGHGLVSGVGTEDHPVFLAAPVAELSEFAGRLQQGVERISRPTKRITDS